MKLKLTLFLHFIIIVVLAQWKPDENYYQQMQQRIINIIDILCSDSLEGRGAGTQGEIKARNIIAKEFQNISLKSYYSNQTYYAPFKFVQTDTYQPHSNIKIGKSTYYVDKDFFIVSYSGNANVSGKAIYVNNGIVNEDCQIDDYSGYQVKELKNNIFLIDISFPKDYNFIDQNDIYNFIQSLIYTAIKKEASALILYESAPKKQYFDTRVKFNSSRKSIPIIYAQGQLLKHIIRGIKSTEHVMINLYVQRKEEISYNVVAIANNQKPTTIVIGGHYDHLGYGSPISRYVGAPKIYPGADDNSSGVAALLEIARHIKNSNLKNHNYVFAAFGAEERGLYGSKAFVDDTIHQIGKIIAMINLDMVGRMDPSKKQLNILGTGTAIEWDSIIKQIQYPTLQTNLFPSGIGGSDQLSFYLKGIPVLFFITGLHSDYHTPNDKPELINAQGVADIVIYVVNLLYHLNNITSLTYNKEIDETQLRERSHKRGVSIGIIPDHTFGGKGVRIDEVFSGRPAAKAGLKAGDIIIKIDEHDVSDLSSYITALSHYREGAKAILTIIREDKTLQFELTF